MGRIPRKNKKGKISKKYLKHLELKDYFGQLTEHEIEIAKSQGLLSWDLWRKAKELRISGYTVEGPRDILPMLPRSLMVMVIQKIPKRNI